MKKIAKPDYLRGWSVGRERVGWSAIHDDPTIPEVKAATREELNERIKETNDNYNRCSEEG